MGMIVSVYTKEYFHEFVLPPINNSDYTLNIYRNRFKLREDISVQLEVIDDCWKICPDEKYKIYKGEEIRESYVLKESDALKLVSMNNDQITLLIREVESPFIVYKKYDISHIDRITIGKNADNLICCDSLGMISAVHAILRKQGGKWFIKNQGSNGLYLNSGWTSSGAKLQFGDFINIIGLHIVFLGNYLAIDTLNERIHVNEGVLKAVDLNYDEEKHEHAANSEELSAPAGQAKIMFHRSPRNIEKINMDEIEIEAPPATAKTKRPPLLLTIGPSFTMAIPMLLGCLLMVYASRVSGGSSGLFMYSGLVMAGSSAVIGVFWAMANMRYQKRAEQEEEAHRFDAYGKYLVEKTETIREKYESNTRALQSMYPAAEVCASYNETTPELWNRNFSHEDFLKCRLGLGNLPFQVSINVPKKKFTLHKDLLEEKPYTLRDNFKMLYKVPILMDIIHHPMTGIVGGKDKKGALEIARILCTQIAATHCYTDVKMAFIYDSSKSEDAGLWDFAKWFPHTWAEDRKIRYIASEKTQISDVCYELTKIFRQRKEEMTDSTEEVIKKPYFVLFLTDISLVEEELLSKYIFDKDEKLGFSVFILSDTYEHLPNACDYIIQNDGFYQGIYNVSAQKEERIDITFDKLDEGELQKLSRRLANIEVQELETGGEIPTALTFFEMYGVSRPQELNAQERWLKNRTYDNIRGMIGQKAGGVPCFMDVHEKYHGPHGLVAGTTGSGKSETLQTYMLSLALNYSPDDVGFFIIDYKGGGMAHLFDGLPHLVGQISNLSGNQVHRAMVSIKSENRRRQRIFNENGVNNINAYTRLVKNKEATQPIPHLFIIIDEFAELKKEEPDFMRELISVAQVGRSLGVHLILATQKPSGTVDDNIWSNSKFRLCLRVQDKEDSMDMLHKPDAAYITQAGRCYLQVGSDEVYELFQSGWSGAPYDETLETGSTEIARLLMLTGKVDVVGGHIKAAQKDIATRNWLNGLLSCVDEALKLQDIPVENMTKTQDDLQKFTKTVFGIIAARGIDYEAGRYNQERLENLIRLYGTEWKMQEDVVGTIMRHAQMDSIKLPTPKEKTQLDSVLQYLAKTSRQNGYLQNHQLWMPILPERIYMSEFSEFNETAFRDGIWKEKKGVWDLDVVIGKMDDPTNQSQPPLHISFSEGGHMAVIGSVVSGKSTLIQSLLYAMTMKYTPQYINVYGIDFSSKMMSAFERAPQIGGIAYEGDDEKIAKLFHMLEEILEERKVLLRGGNYSQYVQVHGVTIPAIFLVIDNFSAFKEKTEDKYESTIITLSKEGVSHGIYLVISAGGFSMNELPGRIAENIRTVVCLEMPDRYAYGDVLHTMKIDVLPETGIKGRGLAYNEGQILEYQVALALEAEDDYQRMERIFELAGVMENAWTGLRARKIPEIPEKPVWTEFAMLDEVKKDASDTRYLPVGYNAESAEIYSINLSQTYCYLITGALRTGKRNFMKVMIEASRMKEADIYIIDAGADMNIFAACQDVHFVRNEDELFAFFMDKLTPVFQARNKVKKDLESQGAEEEELFEAAALEKPIFIYIVDFPWFIAQLYQDDRGMSGFMETLFKKGRFHNIYFIAILSLENRGDVMGYQAFSDFIDYHTGIHFGGNAVQNTFLSFDYLGYQKQSAVLRPGIGLLPDIAGEHEVERIIVPLAKKRRS